MCHKCDRRVGSLCDRSGARICPRAECQALTLRKVGSFVVRLKKICVLLWDEQFLNMRQTNNVWILVLSCSSVKSTTSVRVTCSYGVGMLHEAWHLTTRNLLVNDAVSDEFFRFRVYVAFITVSTIIGPFFHFLPSIKQKIIPPFFKKGGITSNVLLFPASSIDVWEFTPSLFTLFYCNWFKKILWRL